MRSAEVTHAHPEAILGAAAVAVAAIVGGIVAAYTGTGPNGIPAQWLERREPLPAP